MIKISDETKMVEPYREDKIEKRNRANHSSDNIDSFADFRTLLLHICS